MLNNLIPQAKYILVSGDARLPNAVVIVAGDNIEIDTSTPGQIIISSTGGGGGGGSTFSDSLFRVYDNGDNTKKVAFELSGVAAGTTRTITIPNASGILAYASDVAAEAALARNGDNITSGTIADARIDPAITRDSELTAAISALSSVYQPKDTTLDVYAGIDPSASVQSLLSAASYAAMRALLDLEAGTDFYSISATDAAIAAAVAGLYDLKGNINCSANPNYPSASKGDVYVVSVAGKIGGGSGKTVEAGDTVIATADNAGGTEASVGTSWVVSQGNVAFTTQGLAIATAASYAAIRQLLGLDTGDTPTFVGTKLTGGTLGSVTITGDSSLGFGEDYTLSVYLQANRTLSLGGNLTTNAAVTINSFWAGLLDDTSAIESLNQLHTQGANIASASTVNLSTATGWAVTITGTTTITAFTSQTAGNAYLLTFSGALTLTHNATSLICPGGASITTAAGDTAVVQSLGSGNWKVHSYTRADGTPLALPSSAVTLTGTQTLTNKRITPRVQTVTSSATITAASDSEDGCVVTALAVNTNLAAPTGTPTQGQEYWYRFKDNGTARAIAYNSIFRAVGFAAPSTTIANKTLYMRYRYNSTDTKWDLVHVAIEDRNVLTTAGGTLVGDLSIGGNYLSNAIFKNNREAFIADGSVSGSSVSVDYSAGPVHSMTLTGNTTVLISNVPSQHTEGLLLITGNGTATLGITGVNWYDDDVPADPIANGETLAVAWDSQDSGTTINASWSLR